MDCAHVAYFKKKRRAMTMVAGAEPQACKKARDTNPA